MPVPPPTPLFDILRTETLNQQLSQRGVDSEARLAQLACALGAERCGGPLSPSERTWIAMAHREEPIAADFAETTRQALLTGGDPLGEMLCSLRPAALRRHQGAFYTSPVIVSAMVTWLLAHRLDRVVDPGCGSGRFAIAVSRQQPDIPLIAIDTDPLATLLTRAALAVVGARDVQVLQQDYLTLALSPCAGRTGFIANPPYVRHHDLTAEAKAWAVVAGKRLGMAISGLSGLHTLFYLATALNAHPGDVGCFVTSGEWLDTRYGQAIRQLLVERLGLRVLAMLDPQAVPFADAMTTAAITCFVADSPAEQVALDLIDTPESLRLGTADATVERRHLAHAARWSPLLRRNAPLPDVVGRVPLRMIARVHRGVATGRNEFFVLSRGRAARLVVYPS